MIMIIQVSVRFSFLPCIALALERCAHECCKIGTIAKKSEPKVNIQVTSVYIEYYNKSNINKNSGYGKMPTVYKYA